MPGVSLCCIVDMTVGSYLSCALNEVAACGISESTVNQEVFVLKIFCVKIFL